MRPLPRVTNLDIGHYTIDGGKLNVVGTCTLTIRLNKVALDHSFTIIDNIPYPIILGSDFLDKCRAVIDYGKRRFIQVMALYVYYTSKT